MSAIASKSGTETDTNAKAHAETVERFVALVLSGKSADVTRMSKSVTDAERSALVDAGRFLGDREATAKRGIAVVVYTLLSAKAYTKRQDLAADLGVDPSRVTQLEKEGHVIATLGLPEGWKSGVSLTQVRAITQGKGSKELGDLIADKSMGVKDKREKIAGIVARLQSEKDAAKATAKANRDAENAAKAADAKAGKNGAPAVSKATASTDTTDAALASAAQAIIDGVGVVFHNAATWDRLPEKVQQAVSAAIAKAVKATE